MNKLLISLTESIYLIYMFYFFKTSSDFNWDIIPNYDNYELKHLTGNKYGLRICPFGRKAILLLIFLLLFRNYYKIPTIIFLSLVISFVLSLINLNALVYLVPVWLVELWLYKQFRV